MMLQVPVLLGEEVDTWLEERGMRKLLVEYLEQQLPSLDSQARAETTLRLAKLYAELLGETEDRSQRIILEQRGRRLLQEVSGSAAESLRLELLHGTYLGIEEAAESHRLQLLDRATLSTTIERLQLLIRNLEQLGARVDRSLDQANSSSSSNRLPNYSRRSRRDTLQAMKSRIDFLSGWCHYYLAWLTDSVYEAEIAERLFAKVLFLDEYNPDAVSRDLRSSPAFAWAIIGMALSSSLTTSDTSALRWLDLLDLPTVPADIRAKLPGWRLAVLLEHQRFEFAGKLLKASSYLPEGRPVSWIRLAALTALDHAGQPEADALAAEALADLASLGEIGQIEDIVQRYGDAVGSDRFPFSYARAILEYRAAQSLQALEPEAPEADRRHAWRLALKAIESALAADDADQFEDAHLQAALLRAWSIYHLERYEEARNLFESLADSLPQSDGGEALWMAYVSEERRCAIHPSPDMEELDRLVELYLDRFPAGPRAGELMVRRASRGETPSQERVNEFLNVPLDSPARPLARMRAADMLYRLFRESAPMDQQEAAAQYLSLAVPMMQEDNRLGGTVAGARSVARARRVLEVATSPQVLRMVAADSALKILRNRIEVIEVDDLSLDDELDYREVLMRLARDQIEEAQVLADSLRSRNPESIWARLATRRLLERARQDRLQFEGAGARDALQRIVKNGNALLAESPSLAEAIESTSGQFVAASVAESAAELWTQGADSSMGELAWGLYGALLEVSPRNRTFLAGRGRLAALRGDTDEALRCWRIVTAGSRAGSDDWFEARTALV
ncbi:MAG: hypothetical protein VX527_09340, partial [Planctomycetota bacterium]|nr:hypothetical protein [Planctomycetota bacterium]